MKTKLTLKENIFLASMLFGLFFGAGNLIFPVAMGQQAATAMWPAVIGFCLTGVGLPLLGIAAMGISESDGLFNMSCKVGRGFAYFFTCALYLSIGPLFAIPRTATVSYQIGIAPFLTDSNQKIGLCIFTLIFFAIVLFFSLRPSGILTWIGKILNPLFLLFLGILIVATVLYPMGNIHDFEAVGAYAHQSFFTGVLEGYNTMDALASLAFGIIMIEVIRDLGVKDPKHISTGTMKAGLLAIIVMAAIYCSLTVVGAQSRKLLGLSNDGGAALYAIAHHYFGSFGGILLGITITFACLKTSIGLVTSCSTTFSELFPKSCSYKTYAILFSLFSFAISNIGLSRIIAYSLPALLFLYPLTIVLIILCLVGRIFHYNRIVFRTTMTVTILAALLDFITALPDGLRFLIPFHQGIADLSQVLPFAKIGMGWVIPSIVGFIIGLILSFSFQSVKSTQNDKSNLKVDK